MHNIILTFSSFRQQTELRLLFGCRRQQTEGLVRPAFAARSDARCVRCRPVCGPSPSDRAANVIRVTAGVFKTRQAVGWQYETKLKIHDAPESSC